MSEQPLIGLDGKPLSDGMHEIDGQKVLVINNVSGGVDTATPTGGFTSRVGRQSIDNAEWSR